MEGKTVYSMLTAIGGLLMTALSLWSVVRQVMRGDLFLMVPLRFMISGILLTLHFPLTSRISGWFEPHLQGLVDVVDISQLSNWFAIAGLICAQLIVLPTSKDLYIGAFAGALSMRGR